jgi:hypothetical protein
MDSDRLNRWLQLTASFGLLVGIVLVIVQIQQASDLARAQLRSDIEFADQQQELSMLGENPAEAWAKSILAPSSLTPAEVKIMDAWLYSHLSFWRRMETLEEEGILESGYTETSLRSGVRVYFSNPFAKRWWQIERDSDYYSADFRRSMDAAVSGLSQDFGRRLLEGLESEAVGP